MSFKNHYCSFAKQLLILLRTETKEILTVWKLELEMKINPPEHRFLYVSSRLLLPKTVLDMPLTKYDSKLFDTYVTEESVINTVASWDQIKTILINRLEDC